MTRPIASSATRRRRFRPAPVMPGNRYADHYHEVGTFWYAPEIGYVVKIAHHLDSGIYARLGDDEALRVIFQVYPGTTEG
jgi:hypothetical protein